MKTVTSLFHVTTRGSQTAYRCQAGIWTNAIHTTQLPTGKCWWKNIRYILCSNGYPKYLPDGSTP